MAWLNETWNLVLASGPFLLLGFGLAGMVYAFLPTEKVTAHLGKPGLGSVIKASLVGIPLPLCSCSVIPMATSIRQRGASRGATAGFLISTPETGVDSISISYALLGPAMAVIRPVAALVTAMAAGILINLTDSEAKAEVAPSQDDAGDGSCCHSCCHNSKPNEPQQESKREPLAIRLVKGAQYGFVDMFADLSLWLLIGFLLAGLVSAMVPASFFEQLGGGGWMTMGLMLVAGLPLYVCATSSTPLAAALILKGVSPGAALVFLLVGPATNIATMLVVGRDLGRKALMIYLACIGVVAVLFGVATDWFLGLTGMDVSAELTHRHEHASMLSWVAAIVLCCLVFNGLWRKYSPRFIGPPKSGDSCCSH